MKPKNHFLGTLLARLCAAGLVEGGFDKLGYVPIADALQRCEGKARYRVMSELNR